MATKEQSVTLLRLNKQRQVEALNTFGFGLDENARASQFPMYVKWANGLLDVTVAAVRRSDGKNFYFTADEWQSLSATEQGLFLRRGLRVRAYGHSFIVAAESIPSLAWGSNGSVTDATSMYGNGKIYTYYDAAAENALILSYYDGKSADGVVGAPAAEAANNYKAFTEDSDGLEDVTQWLLPTFAQMYALYVFRDEVDAVFTAAYGADFKLTRGNHWCCNQYDDSGAYYMNTNYGNGYTSTKSNLYYVRPIAIN